MTPESLTTRRNQLAAEREQLMQKAQQLEQLKLNTLAQINAHEGRIMEVDFQLAEAQKAAALEKARTEAQDKKREELQAQMATLDQMQGAKADE